MKKAMFVAVVGLFAIGAFSFVTVMKSHRSKPQLSESVIAVPTELTLEPLGVAVDSGTKTGTVVLGSASWNLAQRDPNLPK